MPRLAVLGPDRAPFTVTLDRDVVTVGRSRSCELVLADPTVSREHGRFRQEADCWHYGDLGSRHGSYLNGRRVDATECLEPGDRIGVGDIELVFEPPAEDGRLHLTRESNPPPGSRALPVGDSSAMRDVRRLIERFAPAPVTVLLHGETGTGKELLAHLVHEQSGRGQGPFVVVNSPALPESLVEAELFGTERGVATGVEARPGLAEEADKGTLFLDEVGDLDLAAQSKLLRFLQDRTIRRVGGRKVVKVDVRVVAATHRDLPELVADGRFRLDLYHRLEIATIDVPALRERIEDVPALVDYFLAVHGPPRPHVSREALELLLAHDWPGNVRELEHAVQRALLLASAGEIRPEHLPRALREHATGGLPALSSVDELYQRLVEEGASFWEVVREPYLRRALPRDVARALVARLLADSGGSFRGLARRLDVEDDYRKLVDFLRHNGLRPDDPA